MAGSTFGTLFRVTTAGESHGPGNLCIVDGCPPGMDLSADDLVPDLQRRKPGQSRITSPRKEDDTPEILSGVFEGRTTGTPIAVLIRNRDQRSQDYGDIKDKYRPGHADFTFDAKYGFRDYRGGGRSSARETSARVAAGAIAKKLLRLTHGITIVGMVDQVGDVLADIPDPAAVTLDDVEANDVRCPDPDAAARMEQLIKDVRKQQDSIGGAAKIVAKNVPAGWGEPVFDKLRADLGKAVLSLPAVLGVEFGQGFAAAAARGTEHSDTFVPALGSPHADAEPRSGEASGNPPKITTATNRHGGMLGGITSGTPIVFRCAVKPTSSIPQDRPTVDRDGSATTLATRGRHDPCLLPRFVPMAEAMTALVLADHLLRQRAVAVPLKANTRLDFQ
ncbi:MAG: chorismate synthase [Planctomycetota bacterium]